MRKNLIKFILVLVILSFLFSQTVFAADTAVVPAGSKDMEYLKSVMDMIKEKYKGEISDDKLIEGALKGMFNTMDPYTTYYTPEEKDSFYGDLNGTYQGIGIMIEKQGDYVVIIKVFAASPAEMAGILPGDKFVTAAGKDMTGASPDEVASLVRGPAGTKVKIELIRGGSTEKISLEVPRAQITLNPVTYEIKGDVGYIKLESFGENSNQFISQALSEMDKKNIKKIVLDLRDNGGGLVDQAVAIAQNFVPKGLITKLDFKSEEIADQEYRSNLATPKYKLAVLVNGMSASASEILAGAIQDTHAGTLIGTKTFGKAKVQNLLPILKPEAYEKYSNQLGVKIVDASDLMYKYNIYPQESEIEGYTKITTGTYTTPNGRMIDLQGLTPDISIPDPIMTKNVDVKSIQKLKKTVKPKLGDEGVDVYNAEKILKLAGYDIGTPDTKLDTKTFAAIKKFQKTSGVGTYGTLDFTTQNLLNVKLDKLVISIDLQYAKALDLLNK